jgi:hypothetical protein
VSVECQLRRIGGLAASAGLRLALAPAASQAEGWLRLTGSFIADSKQSTLFLHVEPGHRAYFDHVSVKASSHSHDEHELVFSARGHNESAAATLARGVGAAPAHCENVKGEVLAAWRTEEACAGAGQLWIRGLQQQLQGGGGGGGLAVEERQRTYDLVLQLRWFVSVLSGRRRQAHTFYGANQLPYFLILDDDATFCEGALQRLVTLLQAGALATHRRVWSVAGSASYTQALAKGATTGVHGLHDAGLRGGAGGGGVHDGRLLEGLGGWGALRTSHGLSGLVLHTAAAPALIHFLEEPRRALSQPLEVRGGASVLCAVHFD